MNINLLLIPVYLGLFAFLVYRQFATQAVTNRTLLLLPALLAFGAFQTLGHATLTATDVALLGVNAVLGLATGVWRGYTYRVWTVAGQAWMKGTWATLANWGVLVAIRVVFSVGLALAGIHTANLTADIVGSLFVTFAAQSAVLWLRTGGTPIIQASRAA